MRNCCTRGALSWLYFRPAERSRVMRYGGAALVLLVPALGFAAIHGPAVASPTGSAHAARYVGDSRQQLPVSFRVGESGAVWFRVRFTGTCRYVGGARPEFTTTYTLSPGPAPGIGTQSFPRARLVGGRRINYRTRVRAPQPDGDALTFSLAIRARLVSPKRLVGYLAARVDFYNNQAGATTTTCRTALTRFEAFRLT